MELDQILKPVNDRIPKTGEIRQVAKEGQKHQVDQFLQSTAKKQKLTGISIGDNVVSILFSYLLHSTISIFF